MVRTPRLDSVRAAAALIPHLVTDVLGAAGRWRNRRSERHVRAAVIHQLTRALARATEPAEVARIVAETAADSLDATGAYVERVLPSEPEVQVLAATGSGVPRTGSRLVLPVPIADPCRAFPTGLVEADRGVAPPALRPPPEGRGGDDVLALPLRGTNCTLGALVLVRGNGRRTFGDVEAGWARVIADIGGYALDRTVALGKLGEFRGQAMEIIEGVTDPFITLDGDGRVTYLNATAQQLARRCFPGAGDIVGRVPWTIPSALGIDDMEGRFRRILERGEPLHHEWLAAPLDGWLEIHAYPWKHGVVAYARDISDRKFAEARLVESEARLRTLANHLPDAAIFQAVSDPERGIRCTYVSDSISRFNGIGAEAVVDRPAVLLRELVEWSRAALTAEAARALRTLSPFRIELEADGPSIEHRWYELAAEPRRIDDDQVVWDGLLLDVTRRKRAEQELARLTEGRARLLRGFSHDMKNPLGAADGLAQLLELGELGPLTAQQLDVIARIRASIQVALDLIDDVLDLARAEAGALDLERTAIDVTTLVKELVEQHRPQALAHGLTLEVVERTIHPRAMCDPKRVHQIVGNLITNAIKYTPHGRVVLDIATRYDGLGKHGPWVTIRVRDTGPGIPPEKRESIFDEFTRLDEKSSAGAGVGLSISRRIARLMGGDITVEGVEGGGSAFLLWLPATERRGAEGRADRRHVPAPPPS
jgi:PAS domain S-box-containing protein